MHVSYDIASPALKQRIDDWERTVLSLPLGSRVVADTSQTHADILTSPSPPSYRAIIVAKGGSVINAQRIVADNDEQAIGQARALVDGHAVELWDGLRFIEQFLPVG